MQQTSAAISAEAKEFLGRRPARIITTARIVLVINILLILASLWFIKYPDIIKTPVMVNATGQGEMRISSKELVRPGQKVRVTVYNAGTGVMESRDGVVERVMPGTSGEVRVAVSLSASGMPVSGVGIIGEGYIITDDRRLLSRLMASLYKCCQ